MPATSPMKARAGSTMSPSAALDHALALLENLPFVDGHNDLPWVIHDDRQARGDVSVFDPGRLRQDHDTDIPRMREGRVSAQFWAAFIPTLTPHPGRTVMEVVDIIIRLTDAYPDTFLPARRASDIARAKKAGKIASFIAIEGGVGLENSLSPLRVWNAAGARLMRSATTKRWIGWTAPPTRHAMAGSHGQIDRARRRPLGGQRRLPRADHRRSRRHPLSGGADRRAAAPRAPGRRAGVRVPGRAGGDRRGAPRRRRRAGAGPARRPARLLVERAEDRDGSTSAAARSSAR